MYLNILQRVDVIGVWFNRGENLVIQDHAPQAELILLRDLEPYFHDNPWSRALRGRRVLVIHPFAESIKENYDKNRERLFPDSEVLPSFDLHVMKAVQTIAREPTGFASWFDALVHAKRSGFQAAHIGGAAQLPFGIRGRRWDDHPIISKLFNEYWARPKPSDVPSNFWAVEGGAYW